MLGKFICGLFWHNDTKCQEWIYKNGIVKLEGYKCLNCGRRYWRPVIINDEEVTELANQWVREAEVANNIRNVQIQIGGKNSNNIQIMR